MTTCAIYARLSILSPGETATTRQTEDADAYADRMGWDVVQRFADSGASGWSGRERAEFERMLTAVEARAFDVLLVWKFDRLTRNLRDYARFWEAAEGAGVRLIGVADGVDTGTPAGQFAATIMFATAQNESQNISVRVRRKFDENARAGKPHGGIRRYGFTKDRLHAVPEEAEVVRDVFQRYVSGESIVSLVSDLRDQGVVGTQGKPFDKTRVKRLLANPAYAGLRAHRGEVVAEGNWEPIVTRELWEAAQERLSAPGRRKDQRAPRSYLLTGLAHCGLCGARLRAQPSGPRRRYVCPPAKDGGCSKMTVFADGAEDWAAADAVAELADPKARRNLAESAESNEAADAVTDLQAAESRLEALARLFTQGTISEREYLAGREAAEERMEDARAVLESSSRVAVLADLPSDPEGLAADWNAATFARRRAVLETVVERVVIHPARRGAQTVERERVQTVFR